MTTISHPLSTTRRLLAGAAALTLLAPGPASALPVAAGGSSPTSAGGAQPTIGGSSSVLDVNLNAARTIIDWSTFNVSGSEAVNFYFDQRNWIVLNRVTNSAINIDGTIRAIHSATSGPTAPTGGNVWFYSPQGVAFGPNARVDVGGLLATSATVDANAFLNASNLNIPFTGSGSGGPVTVAGGGQFRASGHLAFVAPVVRTEAGATLNAGDVGTAAFGAVDSYEIRFHNTAANDLAFFTFIVPGVAAGTPHATPLHVASTSTAANTYLIAISRQQVTGLLINAPGLLIGQSSIDNYGQVTITTGRNITNGQVNEVLSTPVVGALTGSVQLGDIDAEGNVNVWLEGTNGSGDIQANNIRAGQGLLLLGNNITANDLSAGDSNVNLGSARIVAAGVVDVNSVTARTTFDLFPGLARGPGNAVTQPVVRIGTATAGANIFFSQTASIDVESITAGTEAQLFASLPVNIGSLTTNAYTRVSSSQTITIDTVVGGAIDLRSAQGITANSVVGATSVAIGTGGPADIGSIVGPSLTMDTSHAILGDVAISGDARVRTSHFDLLGDFTAANLAIESQVGDLSVGGEEEPGVTDEEFQRITVSESLSFYAGQRESSVNVPTPVYGDLTVGDLSIDPARIPQLNFFAQSERDVLVTGALIPTGEGVHLRIGDSEEDSIWKPHLIAITGSLGSAEGDALAGFTDVHAFDSVALTATDDILIGSERFLELVLEIPAAEINIGQGLPEGVAPVDDEVGRLFIVAGGLSAFATDRIVQQNTGAQGAQAGFYLTGQGVDPEDPLLIVGGAQIADMFGALQIGDGVFTTGQQASFSQRVARFEGDTTLGSIRINGCLLGVGCALSTPATQFRIQQFRPAAPRAAVDPPVLTPPPPVEDDERENEAVITGAGNEEIWRRDQ